MRPVLPRRAALLLPLAAAGCSALDNIFSEAKPPLPGKREAVVATRRGLVLSVPVSDDPDGDCETVLTWLVAAAATLGPDEVTGLWQAEIHRR